MSFFPGKDPRPGDAPACDAIERVIVPRTSDIGGFSVRRALPSAQRRMVGPFIFLDHMGPAEFRSGQGIDVRPHPHIGLATVTYLFDGQIMHRDSLGSVAAITPGAVNWMTAGRGIAHSERTAPDHRLAAQPPHRVQSGGAFLGLASPVYPGWDPLFADVALDAGAKLPLDAEAEERAIYLVAGEVDIAGDRFGAGRPPPFQAR